MRQDPFKTVKLVFTAASQKELPLSWLKGLGYPVLTLRGLVSGELSRVMVKHPGLSMLFLITGIGPECSKKAAEIIVQDFHPLAIVNLGTCGLNTQGIRPETGTIVWPEFTVDNSGNEFPCHSHFLFPLPEDLDLQKVQEIQSLNAPLTKRDSSRAAFVDMEAAFQHRVFSRNGIRFGVFKVITDSCNGSTPGDYAKNLAMVQSRLKDVLSFLESPLEGEDVSVVIPVYNRALSVKKAVDSVLAQSMPPGEIIVVDDGSTDETVKVLRNYGDRIRMISSKKNRGVSAARNAGIKKATGKWIALLDSDDIWLKDKLMHQVHYLETNPFWQIMQCDEIWIRNGQRVNKCRHHEKKEGWIWDISLERCMISPSCVILRRDLAENCGLFDPKMPACEDYDLWLRVSRNHPVGFNPHPDVVKYGGHEDQLSRKFRAMDRFRVYSLIKSLEIESDAIHAERLRSSILFRLSILEGGARKRGMTQEERAYHSLAERVKKGHARCRDCHFLLKG